MYNKAFSMTVDSVTPWAGNEEEVRSHGLTLTGTVEFSQPSFLHDLSPLPEYREGINHLLGGRLPIEGDVKLRHSAMQTSQLLFGPGMASKANCEVVSIVLAPPPSRDLWAVRVKIKMRNLPDENYAVLCESLREVIEAKIEVTQQDLFDTDGGEDAPPSVDEVTEERGFTPVPKPPKKEKKQQARPGREAHKGRGKKR